MFRKYGALNCTPSSVKVSSHAVDSRISYRRVLGVPLLVFVDGRFTGRVPDSARWLPRSPGFGLLSEVTC